jgi:hypothetical protein
VIATTAGESSERDALAHYQHLRDSLSMPLFTLTDTISAYRWNDTEIPSLLRQMAGAMTDEVEMLAALDVQHLTIGALS